MTNKQDYPINILGLINNGSLHPCAWTWMEEIKDYRGVPLAPGDRVFSEYPPFDASSVSSLTALYSHSQLTRAVDTVYSALDGSAEIKNLTMQVEELMAGYQRLHDLEMGDLARKVANEMLSKFGKIETESA